MEKLSEEERIRRLDEKLQNYRKLQSYKKAIKNLCKTIYGIDCTNEQYINNNEVAYLIYHFTNEVDEPKYICGIRTDILREVFNLKDSASNKQSQRNSSEMFLKRLDALCENRKIKSISTDFASQPDGVQKTLLSFEEKIQDEEERGTYIAALSLYAKVLTVLKSKLEFSEYVEKAIKKMVFGRDNNIDREEEDAFTLVQYFSYYAPNAESKSWKSSDINKEYEQEANVIKEMKESGTPIILQGSRRIPELGDVRMNRALCLKWCNRWIGKKQYMENAGIEDKDIPFFGALDLMVGTRNSISHGTFDYNFKDRALYIISNVNTGSNEKYVHADGTEEDVAGAKVEVLQDIDCVIHLCQNYFSPKFSPKYSIEKDSKFFENIPEESAELIEKENPEKFTELFKFYINGLFAYNQWLLNNANAWNAITNDANCLGILMKLCGTNNKEECKNILRHLRNAAVHDSEKDRRVWLENGKMKIEDHEIDDNGNKTNIFNCEIDIAEFKNILRNYDMTRIIRDAINAELPIKEDEVRNENNRFSIEPIKRYKEQKNNNSTVGLGTVDDDKDENNGR